MSRAPRKGRLTFTVAAVLGLTVLLAGQARAQYEYEWGKALMDEYRYDDLAEQVFAEMAKRSDKEQKTLGLLGQSQLFRKQAARTDDVAQRAAFNEKAIAMLDQVSSNLGEGHPQYWATQFQLADTLAEIAAEDIRLIERGEVPADKVEELRRTNQNRLDRAEAIYSRAESEYANRDPETQEEEWFLGKTASLNRRILELNKAQLMPEKLRASPSRVGGLQTTLEKIDDLVLDTEGLLIAQHAYYWRARVLEELLKSGASTIQIDDVVAGYFAVPDLMIQTPKRAAEWGIEFEPNTQGQVQLAERAYWSLVSLLNERGRTGKAIEYGERMRADWADAKYPFGVLGDLAMVELARAYQKEGRKGEALAIVATVSEKGGYQGREADKLMSLIIATTPDKRLFDPKMLAAGANGAYAAANNPDAENAEEKALEAIELYRAVLESLDRVPDEIERAELGRLAYFRVGRLLDGLGRYMEAAVTFEQGYRRFNNDKIRDYANLNADMERYWRSVLNQLVRDSGRAAAFTEALEAQQRHAVSDPPKGVVTDASRAKWNLAETDRRAGKLDEAMKLFRELAASPNSYQERAMVKLAAMEMDRLSAKQDATAAEWLAAAKAFDDYKEYARSHDEDDPTLLDARKAALVEADMNIARAMMEAAKAADDAAKKDIYQRVVTATEGFAQRTTDADAAMYMRFLRFQALAGLDRTDEAHKAFEAMLEVDASHRYIPVAAAQLGALLKARFEAMPTISEADLAKRDAAKRATADVYKYWLLAENPSKAGYWALVYNLYYETGAWDEAYELLDKAYEKFKGTNSAEAIRRKLGHTLLERAKKAFNDGDTARTDELFKRAAEIYKDLLGADDNAPTSVLEEAGEVLGGFVVGPNRIGNYTYFPGAGEFQRALVIWDKVYKRVARKAGETVEEQREIDNSAERARFYTYLMAFKTADLQGDPIQARAKLKSQLEVKFRKEQNEPGGPLWAKKYEWLMRQL